MIAKSTGRHSEGLVLLVCLGSFLVVAFLLSGWDAVLVPRHSAPSSFVGSRGSWEGTAPIISAEEVGVSATDSMTYTIYLPIVKCYGTAPSLPPFGIELRGPLDNDVLLSKAVQAGAVWTRRNYLSWAAIEPVDTTPASYNWGSYDSEFANAAGAGITPIVIIADNPSWAAGTRCGPINTDSLPDFAEFVGAVVSRYKDPPYSVKYWELYNEPDGTWTTYGSKINCWGYYGDRYAQMLKVAYPAIKSADPEAQVVMGGLAYDNFTSEGGPFNQNFIEDVLANGGGAYFDIMNFHYYYVFHTRWDPWGKGVIGKAVYLRNRLAAHGVSKPMMCTEVGYAGDAAHLESQANYVAQVYSRGMSVGLGTIMWYPLVGDAAGLPSSGLLYDDLTPKPAYNAYKTMTGELAGFRYKSTLGIGETGYADIEGYEFWNCSEGKTKKVLWTTTGTWRSMALGFNQIRVVSKEGTELIITDGGAGDLDGQVNGRVMIYITPSPIYVEAYP